MNDMQVLFDGLSQPYGITPESLVTLVPLAWWAFERFVRHKRSTWLLPAVSVVLFSLINGVRLWDQWRVGNLPPSALQVTTGVIEETWHIETRTRDWSQKSLSYRKTVSEGFDVAGLRFKWNVGDSYSPATFSNARDPSLTFAKGTPVEVTWFTDDATEGERRIVRLRMSSTAPNDPLQDLVRQLAASLSTAEPKAFTALTRFPFAFGAHTMELDEAPTLWTSLRMPAVQACLSRALAVRLDETTARVDCDGTVFALERTSDGRWQFVGLPQTR